MSDRKNLDGATGGEIQGLLIQSDRYCRTHLGLSPVKRARLCLAWWGLLGTPFPKVKGLERACGKTQHAFLPLRHPMSHLRTLFCTESDRRRGSLPWTLGRWREAITATCLLPLCSVDLSSPWDPLLTASDSSGHGIGVSEALNPPRVGSGTCTSLELPGRLHHSDIS